MFINEYHYFFVTPWEFFTSALADGFQWSLSDSKSPQVSRTLISILADLSNIVFLDSLHPSSYFLVLQSFYQSFGDINKCTNYNWYNRHFHVPLFFQFPSKVEVLIPLFAFFQFHSVVRRDSKFHNSAIFF